MPNFCSTEKLNYGINWPTQNVIQSNKYVEYPCFTAASTDETVPLEFRIDRTHLYTDLSDMFLKFKVKVHKKDGSVLTETDEVSTVNNFAYSLFSSVDVYIQDLKISADNGHYPYMMYLAMLLHTTEHEKKYYLRQSLWRRDTPGMFDNIGTDAAGISNKGFTDRSAYIQQSVQTSLLMKVFFDFKVQQLIPDQCELLLRFNRADCRKCLMANEGEYAIEISQPRLMVARVELTPHASSYYSNLLRTRGLELAATRMTVRTKVISKNDQNCDWSLISGNIPKRIFIFQTLNTAYNGDTKKNPFNFQTFDIQKLKVFCNGQSVPSTNAIDMNSKDYDVLYTMLLNAINRPESIGFNSWEYRNGYFIACFDLTHDRSTGRSQYNNPAQQGTVRITVQYDKPLSEAISIFCLSEETASLCIDSDRNPSWCL